MWRRLRDDFLLHVDLHVIAMMVLILPFTSVMVWLSLGQVPAASTMQSSTLLVLLMAAFNAASMLGPFVYIVFHAFDRVSQQGRSPARLLLWNIAIVEALSGIVAGIFVGAYLLTHAL